MWEKILKSIEKREHKSNALTDIIDGSEYRKLCELDGVLFKNKNLTWTFNTDGVALYKSSRIEIWPVFVAVNEIPPKERFQCKNILWGLWQGRGKPPTYTFSKPFVDDIKKLS